MILKEVNDAISANPAINQMSLERSQPSFVNLSSDFQFGNKDFSKQFAHIYSARLKSLRNVLLKKVARKWGNTIPVRSLSDLADENVPRCAVLGTLYKHQELKPSVLKEISEEHQLVPQPPRSHYTSPDDVLVLEDETQRVRLIGNLQVNELATGVVIAVLGVENDEGKFEVEDHCFAGVEPLLLEPSPLPDDCYIAFVSGLQLTSNCNLFALRLLTDWLGGFSDGPTEQQSASKVCRLLLAGNSVGTSPSSETVGVCSIAETSVLEAAKLLDDVCLDLVRTIPIDIMPGEFDPTNHMLPQQPLHLCILPSSARYQSCQLVSNPYLCEVGGRRILGTSGQPIHNLERITHGVNPITLLESCLEWGHLAPSAPDTLGCYPYYDKDPFLIGQQPEVFFAGNQQKFQTKLFTPECGKPVRLVCIPSFADTQTCVMVNIRTLDCYPITFTSNPLS